MTTAYFDQAAKWWGSGSHAVGERPDVEPCMRLRKAIAQARRLINLDPAFQELFTHIPEEILTRGLTESTYAYWWRLDNQARHPDPTQALLPGITVTTQDQRFRTICASHGTWYTSYNHMLAGDSCPGCRKDWAAGHKVDLHTVRKYTFLARKRIQDRARQQARERAGTSLPEANLRHLLHSTPRLHVTDTSSNHKLPIAWRTKPSMQVDIIGSTSNGHPFVVEYDGAYWHRTKQHVDTAKTQALLENGYKVIRVRENDLAPLPMRHEHLLQLNARPAELAQVSHQISVWLSGH